MICLSTGVSSSSQKMTIQRMRRLFNEPMTYRRSVSQNRSKSLHRDWLLRVCLPLSSTNCSCSISHCLLLSVTVWLSESISLPYLRKELASRLTLLTSMLPSCHTPTSRRGVRIWILLLELLTRDIVSQLLLRLLAILSPFVCAERERERERERES
jgi:hypothetical protein